MIEMVRQLGARALRRVSGLGRMGVFLALVLRGIGRPPGKFRPLLKEIQFIGTKSIFVIGFTASFTGMVLGLQGYYTLSKFGSEGLLGSAVALSMIRELGPVLSALMIAGRAGSAICAEIGIMRIEEQIDALECMAIDPYSYIVTPRFLAALISVPLLVAFANIIGMAGGYLVGVSLLGVNPGLYINGIESNIGWEDVSLSITKSVCFSWLIIWICTYKGFYAGVNEGSFGPEEVSRATTEAVVASSIVVLVSDYVLTSLSL